MPRYGLPESAQPPHVSLRCCRVCMETATRHFLIQSLYFIREHMSLNKKQRYIGLFAPLAIMREEGASRQVAA